MLIEASIRDLTTSTKQIPSTARQHVSNTVTFPTGYQVIKTGRDLVFKGTTDTKHQPALRLTNVQEVEQPPSVSIKTVAGEELVIEPISTTSPAYVTCDCEDFVYRFATTNQQHGVLFGKITRPHIPKTDRKTSNIGKIGVCKHILKFVDLLASENILK